MMTEEMRQGKESFASRWSRRKRQQARSSEEATPPTVRDDPPPAGTSQESQESAELPPVETLPDPDSMAPTDDFSVFLRENVPEMLRRKALRRLWRSNPIIGTVDMLDDYCEDFTDAATVVPALRTVYRLGRGMLEPSAERAAETPPQAAPEGGEAGSEVRTAEQVEPAGSPAEGSGERAEADPPEAGSERA